MFLISMTTGHLFVYFHYTFTNVTVMYSYKHCHVYRNTMDCFVQQIKHLSEGVDTVAFASCQYKTSKR